MQWPCATDTFGLEKIRGYSNEMLERLGCITREPGDDTQQYLGRYLLKVAYTE